MRDHSRTSARRKLSSLAKVELPAIALVAVWSERMTGREAGRFLREATSTQWSLLTCTQYLSGKKAPAARPPFLALPVPN